MRRQGTKGGTKAAGLINEKTISEYLAKQGEDLTLDPDATIIGADKQEAQWTYKKIRGYQPMMAYVNEVCVHWEFREGNEPAGSKAIEFLEACEKKLPGDKELYLRSDSAYYQREVIERYSKSGRTFSITADQDSAVKEATHLIPGNQWQRYYDKDGVETDRGIAETVHCMNHSTQAFRLIDLRRVNPQPELFGPSPYCYHAAASNWPETESASEVIRKHNGRGESENWHKTLKAGYAMEQMPCGETAANAVYFASGVLTVYQQGSYLSSLVFNRDSWETPLLGLHYVSHLASSVRCPRTPRSTPSPKLQQTWFHSTGGVPFSSNNRHEMIEPEISSASTPLGLAANHAALSQGSRVRQPWAGGHNPCRGKPRVESKTGSYFFTPPNPGEPEPNRILCTKRAQSHA